jgi:cytochrome c
MMVIEVFPQACGCDPLSSICYGKSSMSELFWVALQRMTRPDGWRSRHRETIPRFATCPPQARYATSGPQIIYPGTSFMKKMTVSALIVLVSSVAASAALAQDVTAGKSSFNKCLACHAIGEGAKNKVGPELNGLDGRKSGTAPDYSYSDANKNSGITWNEAEFKDYIKDPKAKIPGTKMAFVGIKNEKEINDLWAYVSQYDKDGKTKP